MKKTIVLILVLAMGLTTDVANADFTFGEPVNLETVIPVIDPARESICCLSYDELEIYIASDRPGGSGDFDIWVLKRASTDDDWEPPENLGPTINSPKNDEPTSISSDGLTLYFHSSRDGGYGNGDMYMTTRSDRNERWGPVENLGLTINSSSADGVPYISSDGLELYFNSLRSGGYGGADIYVSKRAITNDPWGEPENLGPLVNSEYYDGNPCVSLDGLLLFFSDWHKGTPRPDGYGGADIWVSRRASNSAPWETAVNLGPPVNGPAHEIIPRLSPDGLMLYFTTLAGDVWDNWQAPILPIVDLNVDGIVDAADMCIVVDNWGTDNKLCDVGPMPWGDGIVDVQDLIVLAEHLFEGAGLVAHWALDETTGDIAYDSAGNIDATVYNGQWSDGKIDGALDFNGLTTYMDCGDSLRFGTRKMTLAMWLEPEHMGGMRYILSRAKEGASDFDYVLMRQYEGQVEFAVTQEGSDPVSVMSNGTTPLNEWTHVAVCLDGSEATIYINGQLDASVGYAQRSSCEDCRLWISSLGKDTRYYNGKIDDVRFYNIALTAEEIASLAQ